MTCHPIATHLALAGSSKIDVRRVNDPSTSLQTSFMKRITITWEMGQGFGHLNRLHKLAVELSDQGHDVTLILYNPKQITHYFPAEETVKYQTLSSPRIPYQKLTASRKPENYSEILLTSIYYDQNIIEISVKKWRDQIVALNPDLVIFDASPTPMLACRGLRAKKINLGDGFFIPPDRSPLPAFNMTKNISVSALANAEKNLISNINSALKKLSTSPISNIHAIYGCDEEALLSFTELDIYAQHRTNQNYIGAIRNERFGLQECLWTDSTAPKVLGYLSNNHPGLANILNALKRSAFEAHLFIPGHNDISDGNLKVYSEPFDLYDALKKAHVFINHGGHSSIAAAVCSGVPSVILPTYQEQFLSAQLCINNQLGTGINPYSEEDTIITSIQDTKDDPDMSYALKLTKNKYSHLAPNDALSKVVKLCKSLL